MTGGSAAPPPRNGLDRFVRGAKRVPGLKAVLLSPVVALPGYWLATGIGLVWGGLASGFRLSRRQGLLVARRLPRWAFGRGGTMVGGVYLTRDTISDAVLRHEAVHRAQWRRYGLVFPLLYFAEGLDAQRNRFEIEAGLEAGGYRRATASNTPAAPTAGTDDGQRAQP